MSVHRFAKLVSFIFHPVIFALLIPFLFAYHRTPSIWYGLEWTLFSSAFLFVTLAIFFFLRPTEFLTDFDISKRQDRPVFYTVTFCVGILYFLIAVILKGFFFPLTIAALGIVLGIGIFQLVNMFIKASIHGAVVWSYFITLAIFYGWVIFFTTIWIPIAVCWSRVYLKKHTLQEIIVGSALGSIITLICFAVGRLLLYN